MTTHILIELDHPPFEVTRVSVGTPTKDREPWLVGFCFRSTDNWDWMCGVAGRYKGGWGDYLISYRGKVEVWPPEDVAKYLKQNPYEACAKVADKAIKDSALKEELSPGDCAALAFNAIRQLEQKEIGK